MSFVWNKIKTFDGFMLIVTVLVLLSCAVSAVLLAGVRFTCSLSLFFIFFLVLALYIVSRRRDRKMVCLVGGSLLVWMLCWNIPILNVVMSAERDKFAVFGDRLYNIYVTAQLVAIVSIGCILVFHFILSAVAEINPMMLFLNRTMTVLFLLMNLTQMAIHVATGNYIDITVIVDLITQLFGGIMMLLVEFHPDIFRAAEVQASQD